MTGHNYNFPGGSFPGHNGQSQRAGYGNAMGNGDGSFNSNPAASAYDNRYLQYQQQYFAPMGLPQPAHPAPSPSPSPSQNVQPTDFGAVPASHLSSFNPSLNAARPQPQYLPYPPTYGQMGQLPSSRLVQQPSPGVPLQQSHAHYATNQGFQQQDRTTRDWQVPPMPKPAPAPVPVPTPMPMPMPTTTTTTTTTPVLMPTPSPGPVASYRMPPQQRFAAQSTPQRINSPNVNSPVAAQSPQYPHHAVLNGSRKPSVGGRVEKTSRVSASPRLATHGLTRSPSVSSTRSPALTPGLLPHHQDTNSLLVCVAEDMFAKARAGILAVAESLEERNLKEYHKLIATGLACLETVLASNKLPPRTEAKLQLRYANILCEETNNVMEAETALTRGITLCEKYRFADLKYMMQFLQLKMLSQRKGKAAMIAVDGRIADAELFKHISWVYALRFFKASMYLQSANPADLHAIENLKAITALALQRGDHVVFVVASLLEGLSLLKNMKDDAVIRIQECLAQSQKYQLDPSIHIPAIDILALTLDYACSLHQKSPQMIAQKLSALQQRMDSSIKQNSWHWSVTKILIPTKKQAGNAQVMSDDTRAILRPGDESDGCDYLVMSFWSKVEAFVMTYTYSGMGQLYGVGRSEKKTIDLWEEALGVLKENSTKIRSHPASLEEAIRDAGWRRELECYLQILRGLLLAAHCKWKDVEKAVKRIERLVRPPLRGVVALYSVYLSGVYKQGTGQLQLAKSIFNNPLLSLDNYDGGQTPGKLATSGVLLLAAFNRLWIMQHPEHRDDAATNDLLDRLRPLCSDHPNREIRTAWNVLLSGIQTDPPIPLTAAKAHLSYVLNESQALGDIQTLSIALNLMRAKLFQNIVGDQALKSAKAGASQARRSGNILWMSVAEGLLAQSYEVQGQIAEFQRSWNTGTQFANKAIACRDVADEE